MLNHSYSFVIIYEKLTRIARRTNGLTVSLPETQNMTDAQCPTILDLTDTLTRASVIMEASLALFGQIAQNAFALDKVVGPGMSATMGPVDGLGWAMSELEEVLDRARDISKTLQPPAVAA